MATGYKLSDKPGVKKKRSERVYTSDEERELLVGCVELKKEDWNLLTPGTWIRYRNREKGFKRGGLVVNVWDAASDGEQGKKRYLRISPSGAGGMNQFNIMFDTIEQIYVVLSTEHKIYHKKMQEALKIMDANVKKLANEIHRLKTKQS